MATHRPGSIVTHNLPRKGRGCRILHTVPGLYPTPLSLSRSERANRERPVAAQFVTPTPVVVIWVTIVRRCQYDLSPERRVTNFAGMDICFAELQFRPGGGGWGYVCVSECLWVFVRACVCVCVSDGPSVG